jgi:N-acetylglucosaminyl-diphospho-decaprenol L-rhamnosyltransferase
VAGRGRHAPTIIVARVAPALSYCVVNTNGREPLLACLDAIERHHPEGMEAEVLVLDNASDDGSAEAVRSRGGGEVRLIALERRAGKAENDSTLLRAARGRYCLLLNEDSELRPGAAAALVEALEDDPRAAAAGAQLLDPAGEAVPCAWRFPGVRTALVGALFLHRRLTVQGGGGRVRGAGGRRRGGGGATHSRRRGPTGRRHRVGATRAVDWAQSSALLVRREAAAEVGYLDPDFFVYYDECDFARRLRDAGWRTLFVPAAEAVHHDQLSTDLGAGLPRIVEFHRNRDLYMRKHHSRPAALAVRLLTAWSYALRALAATVLRGHPARVYAAHARQALFPNRGTGLRERATPKKPGPAERAKR